ncbi:MAG TPA: YdiU family protein [Candidatus Limnocylindria bacterium]|nr:YdiU family protein [Candidatus Limnocylindria bacterium]
MAIAPPRGTTLEGLRFTNSFAALGEAFGERREPTGIDGARLVAFSEDAAALIALLPSEAARPEFRALIAGNALVRGMEPVAALYGGHQFGVWAGQLGDGRAILLGEVRDPSTSSGQAGEPWELQLKGAGRTAYSRFADGRAVVRSTIREFLCSEAMHHLGVPTTRALAMAAGDEPVLRERVERAATLVRMAPTFVRFGSFEIFQARGQHEHLKTLADYVIDRFFPDCGAGEERYARFFAQVVDRTARLMARWQSVGFAHGVMNTDNFSILGLTLDYGPFGFLEAYEPHFICNHTDETGRYAFDAQPTIGLWNCYALADALGSLIPAATREAALATYAPAYREEFVALHRAKLGLADTRDDDADLLLELFRLLEARRVDWTRFWRALSHDDAGASALLGEDEASRAWFARYAARAAGDPRGDAARRAAMRATNPKYVLRNWVAQQAIEACEVGDDAVVRLLHEVLRAPYDEHPEHEAWAQPAPARYAGLSVSCSS